MSRLYVGIDFHKNNSVLYTTDQKGELVSDQARIKTVCSKGLVSYFSNKSPCVIGIEATGGVNPVVSQLKEMGHEVRVINPNKFRGIGISGKKTDERDAKALNTFIRLNPSSDCEVFVRSESSRTMKSLLVARELTVRSRVNITNHIRSTLRECNITLAQGVSQFWAHVGKAIESVKHPYLRETLKGLLEQASSLKAQEQEIQRIIMELNKENESAKRLQSIPGVGPLTAITMLAIVDEIQRFPDADKFASYLGLVPSVTASANKTMMGSITRSGSEILRRYIIHGARSWLKKSKNKTDPIYIWATEVENRRGTNKAVVALARKMSRIAFAILRDGSHYKEFAFENRIEQAS